MPMQMEFKIIRLATGGFVVKNAFFDNIFASTRIDEALMYVRDQMTLDALTARHDAQTHAACDNAAHVSSGVEKRDVEELIS